MTDHDGKVQAAWDRALLYATRGCKANECVGCADARVRMDALIAAVEARERARCMAVVEEVERLRAALERAASMVNGYPDTDSKMSEEVILPTLRDHAVAMQVLARLTGGAP